MSEGMKAAKASPDDVDQMRDFLFELNDMVNNPENSIHDIGTFCHAHFNHKCGRHFQRVLFGYDTLIENACDPTLSYLDWKPEIKEAITAFQHRLHADAPFCAMCGAKLPSHNLPCPAFVT